MINYHQPRCVKKTTWVLGFQLIHEELAQSFQRLGCEVTVVIGSSGKIMGKEDDEAAELVPGPGASNQFSSWDGSRSLAKKYMAALWWF